MSNRPSLASLVVGAILVVTALWLTLSVVTFAVGLVRTLVRLAPIVAVVGGLAWLVWKSRSHDLT
jgi:hypothetical protein